MNYEYNIATESAHMTEQQLRFKYWSLKIVSDKLL